MVELKALKSRRSIDDSVDKLRIKHARYIISMIMERNDIEPGIVEWMRQKSILLTKNNIIMNTYKKWDIRLALRTCLQWKPSKPQLENTLYLRKYLPIA